MSERFEADYLIETAARSAAAPPRSWPASSPPAPSSRSPARPPELKARSAARVERLDGARHRRRRPPCPAPPPTGAAATAAPTSRSPGRSTTSARRCPTSWPPSRATSSSSASSPACASLDIRLPPAFAAAYPGPQFGIAGTRRLAGVARGPLIGTIVKPSVGLCPEGHRRRWSPARRRRHRLHQGRRTAGRRPALPLRRARRARSCASSTRHADRTGKKVMFAFNLTGEVDEMRRRHDLVRDAGGTCVMVSLNRVGLAGLLALRRHAALPIHAHRNGWGYLSPPPRARLVDYAAWSEALAAGRRRPPARQRPAATSSASPTTASSPPPRACSRRCAPDKPCIADAGVLAPARRRCQPPEPIAASARADLIYAAGGGIIGHPDGAAAGVERAARGLGRRHRRR